MTDYENLMELIRGRRSIRRFAARPVARDDIMRLLEAARWAPSNHNRQPWKFIVLSDKTQITHLAQQVGAELAEKLKELPKTAFGHAGDFSHYATVFSAAPSVIAVLHKRPVSFSTRMLQGLNHPDLVSGEPLSAAMAVQNLMLAAHAIGLATCVMTAPLIASDFLLRDLNVPTGYELTCLVALGYADETPAQPRRKSIEQIIEFREDGSSK